MPEPGVVRVTHPLMEQLGVGGGEDMGVEFGVGTPGLQLVGGTELAAGD